MTEPKNDSDRSSVKRMSDDWFNELPNLFMREVNNYDPGTIYFERTYEEAKRAREAEKHRDIFISELKESIWELAKKKIKLEKENAKLIELVATLEVAKDYYKTDCKEPRD